MPPSPWLAGLAIAALLAGCLDGGSEAGGPANAASASGVWRGTFEPSHPSGTPLEALGLVSEGGEARFVFAADLGRSMVGVFSFSSGPFGNISATTYRPDGNHPLSGAAVAGTTMFSGEFNSRRTIWGTYTTPLETGTFDLFYDAAAYAQASLLPLLTGVWLYTSGGFSIALPLNQAGIIGYGADTSGCSYSGSVAIIDAALNAYRVRLTASGCAIAGEYTGLAALLTGQQPNDTLLLALSNPDRSLTVLLQR